MSELITFCLVIIALFISLYNCAKIREIETKLKELDNETQLKTDKYMKKVFKLG